MARDFGDAVARVRIEAIPRRLEVIVHAVEREGREKVSIAVVELKHRMPLAEPCAQRLAGARTQHTGGQQRRDLATVGGDMHTQSFSQFLRQVAESE